MIARSVLAVLSALALISCNNKYEDSPTLDGFQPPMAEGDEETRGPGDGEMRVSGAQAHPEASPSAH